MCFSSSAFPPFLIFSFFGFFRLFPRFVKTKRRSRFVRTRCLSASCKSLCNARSTAFSFLPRTKRILHAATAGDHQNSLQNTLGLQDVASFFTHFFFFNAGCILFLTHVLPSATPWRFCSTLGVRWDNGGKKKSWWSRHQSSRARCSAADLWTP